MFCQYVYRYVLCDGELRPSTVNPIDPAQKLFILIDPTHTIKNVYNCFQKSTGFNIPLVGNFGPYKPTFVHVKQLYEMESASCLRMAHKLTPVCLSPTNIQRTSAKLAFATFDDSTVSALTYHSHNGKPQWEPSARFLGDISTLVKVRILSIISCILHSK